MADREFPAVQREGGELAGAPAQTTDTSYSSSRATVELGLGQDAAAEAEAVLPVADVEGGDRRMMGDLSPHRHSR